MNLSLLTRLPLKVLISLLALSGVVFLWLLLNISSAAKAAKVASGAVSTSIALTKQVVLLTSTASKPLPRQPNVFLVNVFAAQYPFENTRMHVSAGERVEFSVQGAEATWGCNRPKRSDPNGYVQLRAPDLVYASANQCALIGAVATRFTLPTNFFLIGSHTIWQAPP